MTWFKVDDSLAFHSKVVEAGNAAMGLWVRAGAYCGQHLTDGFIPHGVAKTMGKPSEIKRLLDVNLWKNVEGGYVFHEWDERQPSREEVEAKREAEAKKKADWRAKRAAQRAAQTSSPDSVHQGQSEDTEECPPGTTESVPGGVPGGVPTLSRSSRPDPTRPDPSSSKEEDQELLLSDESDTVDPFIEFWKNYPRKTQKRDAEKAYRRALKRASAEQILEGLKRYQFNPDRTFQPQAERWLNGDRWADAEETEQAPLFDTSKLPQPGTGWAPEQLDMVLGKDTWTVPEPPADLDDNAGFMWQQAEIRKHRALRIQAANKAIGRVAA